MMKISALAIYPLKSGRGIELEEADCVERGLQGDRRLLLVSPNGKFITQRELPDLARLTVTPMDNGYTISMDGKGTIHAQPGENRMDVEVWGAIINAAIAPDAVTATLSEWLGQPAKLAFFDENSHREATLEWAGEATPVSFADAYPVLVTTTGSLRALNENMQAHAEGNVGMERFRPNIVVDCDEPWAEDHWATIEINGVRIDLVKPCSRCIMTSQDQTSGSRSVPSPIPAMGRLRMSADRRVPGPLFGWNGAPRGTVRLAIGDVVRVIGERPEGWPLKRR